MKSNDPRSIYYDRKYIKEKINYVKLLFFIILFVLILFLNYYLDFNPFLFIVVIIIYFIISIKHIVLLIVKIYQRIAPISIRSKCRFEPSCSEYMILSINKYGFIKGFSKGIDRLKRCNINDGGFDEP